MVETILLDRLKKIFQFKKTTFSQPSDSHEQDTLFVDIAQCRTRVTEGKEYAKVSGSLTVYSNKLPFGYFRKQVQRSDHALTRDFFFDIELSPDSSPARLQNITERRVGFIFLYTGDYDPAHGELTEVDFY